jgi:hypothetical protein
MGFMKPEITDRQKWYKIEGNEGTQFFPADCFNKGEAINSYQGRVTREPGFALTVWGYGARLSAPGYLDATDWTVFTSLKDAEEYLKENFGEDE